MQVQGKNKAVEIRRIKRERLSQQRENRADKQGNGQVVVDFDFIADFPEVDHDTLPLCFRLRAKRQSEVFL